MEQERLSKILVGIIKISILAILILPMVINSHFFFPFIVLKNILFRVIIEIVFCLYIILALANSNYRPKFNNKVTLAVLSFFGTLVLSTFFSVNIGKSMWSNFERMDGFFAFLHLILYFIILFNVFKEKKDWHQLFTFSIFISILMSFVGLSQYFNFPFLMKSSGGLRLSGTIGNATFFASYLLFHLFFLIYFFSQEKKFDIKLFTLSFLGLDILFLILEIYSRLIDNSPGIIYFLFKYPPLFIPFLLLQVLVFISWYYQNKYLLRFLIGILFLLEFFIFFNTQTRGAILAFIGGIFILGFINLFLTKSKLVKISSLMIVIVLLILPILIYFGKNSSIVRGNATLDRLASISLKDVTTESRLLTWQASWQGWTENLKTFLVGVGLENYNVVFNKHFPVKIFRDAGSQVWFDRAHNIIFDISVTSGLFGLLSYLSIFVLSGYLLFRHFKTNRKFNESFLLIVLLITYFLQNFFVFDTLNTEIIFYLLLAFIVFLTTPLTVAEPPTEKVKVGFVAPTILVIVLFILIYSFNYIPYKANHYIFEGLTSKSTLPQEKVDYLLKSINYNTIGKYEARQHLTTYALNLVKEKDFSREEALRISDLAIAELKKSIKEAPLDVKNYLFLANALNATVSFDPNHAKEAEMVAKKAIELSTSRPQLYFELGQAKLFQKQFEEAVKYFKKGVDLNPEVVESHLSLTYVYLILNQDKEAEEELRFIKEELNYQLEPADYLKIIDIYLRLKRYDKVIENYQSLIAWVPKVAEYHSQLAAIYAKIGENEKAKAEVKKAVELNPSFATEANNFLELLEAGELREK